MLIFVVAIFPISIALPAHLMSENKADKLSISLVFLIWLMAFLVIVTR